MPPHESDVYVEILCGRCGGYGVTLDPSKRVKHRCDRCDGAGSYPGQLRSGWKPQVSTLEYIDTYEDESRATR